VEAGVAVSRPALQWGWVLSWADANEVPGEARLLCLESGREVVAVSPYGEDLILETASMSGHRPGLTWGQAREMAGECDEGLRVRFQDGSPALDLSQYGQCESGGEYGQDGEPAGPELYVQRRWG